MNGCTPLAKYDRVHTIIVLLWSRNFNNSYLTMITCLSIKNEIIHTKQQSNKDEAFLDSLHRQGSCHVAVPTLVLNSD